MFSRHKVLTRLLRRNQSSYYQTWKKYPLPFWAGELFVNFMISANLMIFVNFVVTANLVILVNLVISANLVNLVNLVIL